jgi:hypothetical protein
MEFWYIWARIAITEADKSVSARGRFGASVGSADDSRALDDEFDSGVVAVCAVAFSLEALTLLLTPMVMPKTTIQAWATGSPTKFSSRLRETLKHSITLPGKRIQVLMTDIEPAIQARGAAVHYIGDFEEPVPHPVAVQSHQDMITYGAEKASEAVRAMRAIYTALFEHPKPAVQVWVEQEEATLRRLVGLPENVTLSDPGVHG